MARKPPTHDLTRLGRYITAARRARYGTVSKAIAAAGVNSLTWAKAERGERIREDRLTAIEKALGWEVGDGWVIAAGGEPTRSTETVTALEALSNDDLLNEIRRRLDARGDEDSRVG